VALLVFVEGGQHRAQAGTPPPAPYYRCFTTLAGSYFDPGFEVVYLESVVDIGNFEVGPSRAICAPALKNGQGDIGLFPPLRCFAFYEETQPIRYFGLELETQFGTFAGTGSALRYLCVPMVKGPIGGPPPGPYWACYPYGFPENVVFTVDVDSQFGSEAGVSGGTVPRLACVPALKGGQGDLLTPALVCWTTDQAPVAGSFNVVSQYATEVGVAFDTSEDDTGWLCVPARIVSVDADDDYCTSEQEAGTNPAAGGQRSDFVFWDFFDTPTPPSYTRNEVVSIADIAAVVARFGSSRPGGAPDKTSALVEAHSIPPLPPAYHVGYDRKPSGIVSGPPDGHVTVQDISVAVKQFGHSCV
jgi:hypothetical protein